MSWTHDRPSGPMLHRIVVLAKRSADALELILRGSQADPPAPLPAATSGKQKKQRPAKGGGASSAAAAAAAAAMLRLFARDEGEYDVLIRFRLEALPNGERGSLLPGRGAESAATASDDMGKAAAALATTAAAAAAEPLKVEKAAVSKQSRAILSSVPQSEQCAGGTGWHEGQLLFVCVHAFTAHTAQQ
jgi:U3 small nucleolar RNA-associated protein 22